MKHLYSTVVFSMGFVLLASGCSNNEAKLDENIKKPKVYQVIDADLIVEENKTQQTEETLPHVYNNVDATRPKNLENTQDYGNYLNEQAAQSKAVSEALQLKRK